MKKLSFGTVLFFRLLTTLLVSLAISASTSGKQPLLNPSQLSAQLTQTTITAIHKDKYGFLWIGTQDGLYQFGDEGSRARKSGRKNSRWMPSARITDIAELSDGTLFVSTLTSGLLKLSIGTQSFQTLSDPLENLRINMLLVTSSDDIWLITDDNVLLYETGLGRISELVDKIDFIEEYGRPHTAFMHTDKFLLVGTSRGLIKFSLNSNEVAPLDLNVGADIPIPGVSALGGTANDQLLIGTTDGSILLWDFETSSVAQRTALPYSSFVSSTLPYRSTYIVASDIGLFLYDKNLNLLIEFSDKIDGLSSSDVGELYPDGEYIWVGTYGGLDILSFVSLKKFDSSNDELHNDVLAFAEDANSRLWVGTYDGLYLFDEKNNLHRRYGGGQENGALKDERITSIAFLKDEMWVGYYQRGAQIVKLSEESLSTPPIHHLDNASIVQILTETQSSSVWIATENSGLFRIKKGIYFNYLATKKLEETSIIRLLKTQDGDLLVASVGGVYQYQQESDVFQKISLQFQGIDNVPHIYSINEHPSGDIFVGTSHHGLFKYDASSTFNRSMILKPVSADHSLKNTSVYGIEFDPDGNVWISSNNGVVKLSPNGQLQKRFGIVDGLQGEDFNHRATFTSRAGDIYFGGANGYNKLNPGDIKTNEIASPLKLTSISTRNQEISIGRSESKDFNFLKNEEPLTLNFSTLDFIDPTKNQYRYKLENFDPDWIDSGSVNSATYTDLPPGNYVFKVQGANSSGIWNREGASIEIHVLPPPWLSWWAYCLYCLALATFLWGFHRIYRSYAIDRKATQLALEMHLAEERADDDMQEQVELQEDLVKSAYKHNMATLSLVSEFIEKGEASEELLAPGADASANKLRLEALSYLEDCLYFQAGGPVADLHKYSAMVIEKLLLTAPVNQETIVTVNEVPEQLIQTSIASPLSAIIYELLSNSINHAFEPGSTANYLQITLTRTSGTDGSEQGRTYELCVSDSGTGIAGNVTDLSSEHSGLRLVESLASQLGGVVRYKTESGTTVSVQIPCPPQH